MSRKLTFTDHLKSDVPAGIVVLLVALPLCLGIALACKVSPLSGIIAGIIGGIVVGLISGSAVGVSGPAAGLTVVVIHGIQELGSFSAFLLALVAAGIIQILLGILRAGVIAYYYPSSVIKGMLSAIGIILILKQIPHALGYDADYMGDEYFNQHDGRDTFNEIAAAFSHLRAGGAVVIFVISIVLLVITELKRVRAISLFSYLPPAFWIVVCASVLGYVLPRIDDQFILSSSQRVQLPETSVYDLGTLISKPDFSVWNRPAVYLWALTIAAVASLETLLCAEATDKLDPARRVTPANRELVAQGIGNIFSGLVGGLPITQVIVRSAANINAGAVSKWATVVHGILLLLCVLFIPHLLNYIPNSSLAAILMLVGYKLASYQVHLKIWRLGWEQFLPYITTIVAILLSDLLKGIAAGLIVSLFLILRKNYLTSYYLTQEESKDKKNIRRIILSQEVSFLNKASLMRILNETPENSILIIDGSKSAYIDYDVLEIISTFKKHLAPINNIDVRLINIPEVDTEEPHG